jgi:hypothetical protein
MSDMIERIARALHPLWWEWADSNNGGDGLTRWTSLEMARSAMQAMLGPTRQMVEDVMEANPELGYAECCEMYNIMISAALSQDTHSLPLKPQEAVKPAVETPQAPAAGTNSTGGA